MALLDLAYILTIGWSVESLIDACMTCVIEELNLLKTFDITIAKFIHVSNFQFAAQKCLCNCKVEEIWIFKTEILHRGCRLVQGGMFCNILSFFLEIRSVYMFESENPHSTESDLRAKTLLLFIYFGEQNL